MYNVTRKRRKGLRDAKANPGLYKMERVYERVPEEPIGSSTKGSYVKPDEELSLEAGDRKDRLDSETRAGRLGPFAGSTQRGDQLRLRNPFAGSTPSKGTKGNWEGPHPAEGTNKPIPGMELPPISTDPQGMADHHQRLADYFGKFTKPGSQSLPATTQMNAYEKSELSDDTDMKPEQ